MLRLSAPFGTAATSSRAPAETSGKSIQMRRDGIGHAGGENKNNSFWPWAREPNRGHQSSFRRPASPRPLPGADTDNCSFLSCCTAPIVPPPRTLPKTNTWPTLINKNQAACTGKGQGNSRKQPQVLDQEKTTSPSSLPVLTIQLH